MKFNTQLISKYRNVLMGIGIIDVLLWHLANCYELQGLPSQIFGVITRSVFTPGFLFLTGFGIFYSYSNNSNKTDFYKRRIARLLIPFWIMVTSIFLLRLLLSGKGDLTYYLGMVTTVSFWIPGKSFNYWYIAVIVLFYLFYPYIHDYIFGYKTKYKSDNIIYVKISIICFILVLTNIILYYYYPFYKEIDLALPKLPMLFIGVIVGYLSKYKALKINILFLGGVIMIVGLCFVFKQNNPFCEQYYYIIDKIFTIPFVIIMFEYLNTKYSRIFEMLFSLLSWFGKYTLELYVIHIYLMRVVSDFPNLQHWAEWWISVPISLIICVPVNKFTKEISESILYKNYANYLHN